MQACSRVVAAAAPVSSRVLDTLPFVNISAFTQFSDAVYGHTDSSLVRVRDWAYLGLRIPPSAFFHPESFRSAVRSTVWETSPASRTISDRRTRWAVPDLELESPLLRNWKLQVTSKAIAVSYLEHAHIRASDSGGWAVVKPVAVEGVSSGLEAAAPHKELEFDADGHASITAECGKRALLGQGSHRSLETTVHLRSASSLVNCEVIVAELFDQGIYVDRYEVAEAHRMGVNPSHVTFFTDIDLEKPAYESTQNFIFIHSKVDTNNSISTKLPVHFRYQAPTWSTTHEPVPVVSGEVYIRCSPSKPWVHVTHWGRTGHDTCELATAHIPVGDRNQEGFIFWATLIVTSLGGVALVLYVTDCCAPSEDQKAAKKKKDD